MKSARYPLFVQRDLDGFFGLFIDNIVQLLLIVAMCTSLCGMDGNASYLVTRYILPGVAVSMLIGNLFYAWQAHRLARKTGRDDVTAQPYGINTPSMLIYIFFVMAPVFRNGMSDGLSQEAAARLAWQMGLVACLGSGVLEFAGAFVAEWIRKHTPRAALLSTLAGIAIGFIAMTFALRIFHRPMTAMLPMGIILLTLFARARFPLGLPGGFVAVLAGTLCAWILPHVLPASIGGPAMSPTAVSDAWAGYGFETPHFVGGDIWEVLQEPTQWLGFLSVIIPMGLFNIVGSLQNIESAEAAGDSYDARSSLAVNGVGTITAALFGSCFPTTIYIGHPGWKSLGARAGYSTLNGVVITAICLTGMVGLMSAVIPIEVGIAIILWIGIIITAQAFQTVPHEHAPAVAMGLFPAIAAWGATVTWGAFIVACGIPPVEGSQTMQQVLTGSMNAEVNGFLLSGLNLLERGYIFTCMFLAAISAMLIDRRFYAAAIWSLIAAAFAALGLTHAYQLSGNAVDYLFTGTAPSAGALAVRGYGIALGYVFFALLFSGFGRYAVGNPQAEGPGH